MKAIYIFSITLIITFSNCQDKNEMVKPVSAVITIDDAPRFLKNTNLMMDVLKKHNAKAIFFCIGIDIAQNKETMLRIVSEGHIIGNHTYNHQELSKLSNDSIMSEINKTQILIDSIQPYNPRLVRAPYSAITDSQQVFITKQKYKILWWNYDAADWDNTITLDSIISYHKQAVENDTLNQSIFILHLSDNSVIALDSLLTLLKRKQIIITTDLN